MLSSNCMAKASGAGRPEYRRAGGFARIATLVQRLREAHPGSLLVECGDEIHGTGPAQWTKGAALPPVLNELRPAVLTPGNWEWGFGPDMLRQRVSELQCPVLACNVEDAKTGKQECLATYIDESTGVRIGFLGVTSPIVTEKMPRPFGAGLRFSDPVTALPPHVDALRGPNKVDLVVMVSHVGLAQDVEIVKKVSGIDVVLSGHTHDRLTRPVVVGLTILIQSSFGGSFVGRLSVTVDGGNITSFEHELLEVDEAIEPKARMAAIVDAQLAPFRERMNALVGKTLAPFHRLTAVEAPMDNVLTVNSGHPADMVSVLASNRRKLAEAEDSIEKVKSLHLSRLSPK